MYRVLRTREFEEQFNKQNNKEQGQINSRIARIREDGHFGIAKKLDNSLAELKWKNGRRIYFTTTYDDDGNLIILLLGGNKNTQQKDIKKAKSIIRKLNEED